MKIFGLDFTSAPDSKKPITAAVCDLNDERSKQTLDKEHARRDIIRSLLSPELSTHYGVTIELPDMLAETCIQNSTADNIDALLCTMQAAWAYTQRAKGYGIPLKCNKIEGWIVDPGLADPST